MLELRKIQKPEVGEFIPYTSMYIDLVPDDGFVLQRLMNSIDLVKSLVKPLSDEKLSTPCAPGEWTIKEILTHVMDTERIFAYRALCFARNDKTDLPGFDQDNYAIYSEANKQSIKDILDDLTVVHLATVTLFNSFSDEVLMRCGVTSGHPTSVRAEVYQIAGHELHHINSIKENYL